MTFIAVIAHVEPGGLGLVGEVAESRGCSLEIYRPFAGEQLPAPSEPAAVVVLGGPQSAHDVDRHPYLVDEERFLADAVAADVPVLAICLGSQILARALGGSSGPGATGLEAGFITITATTPDGDVAGEYFSFHSDEVTPPDEAQVLAVSDRYVQAYRAGSALAVQFHPEMTRDGVETLLAIEGEKLARYGVDVEGMRREAQRYFAAGAPEARGLLDRWFARLALADPATTTVAKD